MRFWVQTDEVVVELTNDRIFVGGDFMQGWVLDYVSIVTHRIFDLFD